MAESMVGLKRTHRCTEVTTAHIGQEVTVMGWVDAIVFALVAVYFVNLYFFQNYVIPSSSLEKSFADG